MKMSIQDPGAIRYKVFLDGVELHDCIAADEDTGTATVYMRNANGQLPRDLPTKEVHGRIEFRRIGQ